MPENCRAGTLYTDELGRVKYCPGVSGEYGLDYESSWWEQAEERGSQPLWDIMENQEQFMSMFDMSEIYGKLPDYLSPPYTLARGLHESELGMLGIEKDIEQRTASEMLKSGAMASGGRLASTGFSGSGASGRTGAKERKQTLRDYGQSMEDISLKGAQSRTDFEETIADYRFRYGEEVAKWMTALYSVDPSEEGYAAGEDEGCDPDSSTPVWLGDRCVSVADFQAMIGDL